MTLGEKLKELRIKENLSQEDLAIKLNVSRQAVSKREQNLSLPDTNNLILIAKIFHVTLDELVNYNDNLNTTSEVKENKESSEEKEINEDVIEEEEEKEYEVFEKSPLFAILSSLIFITSFLVFILVGVYVKGGWNYSWIALLFIPVFLSLIESVKRKRISAFLFPVLIVAIYMILGLVFGLWHPYWFIFLFIPLFYIIAEAIDRAFLAKRNK